jgi:multiple sugar transport system substrate-binding protein
VAQRHGVRALLGSALLCLVVAGCTTDPERGEANPTPSEPRSSSTSPQPVGVDVAVYGPEESLDAYDELAHAFMRENPHVTVEVKHYADATEVMEALHGELPPDVFLMDHTHLPQLVEDELVRPVDGLLAERKVDFGDGYQRGGLTAFSAEASLQCMPHDVSPVVVYYNEDLVDLPQLGEEGEEPPNAIDGWDWEVFVRAARQASRGPADGL